MTSHISRRRALGIMGAAAATCRLLTTRAWAGVTRAKAGSKAVTDTSASPHVALRSVDMDAVQWKGGFWGTRFDLARTVMIPAMWDVINMPDNGCTFVTFGMAAGGPKVKTYVTPYSDGDCYKWVEAVAHAYAVTRDPALGRRMDEAIAVIAKAQAPDGYISTPVQVRNGKRWEKMNNHEFYNMGHLITASVVHHRATGKENFLNVGRRAADYLYVTFSPKPPELVHMQFNATQIMGLVELFRLKREPKYLELAGLFLDDFGTHKGGSDQNQDRTPFRKEKEAVGHAVLAAYMYAGAADIVAETNDAELRATLDRVWQDAELRKMYLTGAIGALHSGTSQPRPGQGDMVHEAFGLDYQLPTRTAYNETCANIANAMWNWRMLTLTGDAKYADIMERVFYNSMLSGVSLKGTEFFYTNVLRRDASLPLLWNDTATRWPNTAIRREPDRATAPAYCCPPNVLRTFTSMHEYFYSTSDNVLWVHFYAPNDLSTVMPDGRAVKLTQQTNFPWDGHVALIIGEAPAGEFALKLRIPAWARGASIRVNGKRTPEIAKPGAYATLTRSWKAGDTVELDLPMKTRLVTAPPQIDETRGQVAVMRGPMVYCIESVDLPEGITIDDLALTPESIIGESIENGLLGGVTTVQVSARRTPQRDPAGTPYQDFAALPKEKVELRMIPYYAWDNRGAASMTVWLPLLA